MGASLASVGNEFFSFFQRFVCFCFPALKHIVWRRVLKPPLGSFHYASSSTIEIHHEISAGRVAALMKLAMFNDNDAVISFHAKLTGTVNGKPSSSGTTEFSGYAYAKKEAIILFERIVDVPMAQQMEE